MAMEPMLLVCGGCGAKVRAETPARVPSCLLCDQPSLLTDEDDAWDDLPRRSARGLTTVAMAVLATVAAIGSLALRNSSPGTVTHPSTTIVRIEPAKPAAAPFAEGDPDPTLIPEDVVTAEPVQGVPDLALPPSPQATLAIRDSGPNDPPVRPKEVVPAAPVEVVPLTPKADAAPSDSPRRMLVRDSRGRAIVAREHGMLKDRMAVLLPDGRIGWPDGQVFTDKPFVPARIDELRAFLQDVEYPTSRVQQTKHYLVFYQGSESFAAASAELLEKLYSGLTETLKKHKMPVNEPEFPLVAVIFRTEDDFRADRKVSPDVQACYEILSNRIYFYEKSRRDQDSPEVSALRKPQTVAHEGTHQILHNVGIQPRLSPWPLWLVEGFAEYCSPPKTTKKGVDWAGLGHVNPIHLATIRDLDDPLSNQAKDGLTLAPVARDRKIPLVEHLVTQTELTPRDYALSWALTHYLALKRVDGFVAYMKRMSRLKPFESRTPEQQLADFRECFGDDLVKLDANVAKYLKTLKVPDSLALPYYAVMIEQPVNARMTRRLAMVSQSPSVIRQWVESLSDHGASGHWQALPFPSRARAELTAKQWMEQGR